MLNRSDPIPKGVSCKCGKLLGLKVSQLVFSSFKIEVGFLTLYIVCDMNNKFGRNAKLKANIQINNKLFNSTIF